MGVASALTGDHFSTPTPVKLLANNGNRNLFGSEVARLSHSLHERQLDALGAERRSGCRLRSLVQEPVGNQAVFGTTYGENGIRSKPLTAW